MIEIWTALVEDPLYRVALAVVAVQMAALCGMLGVVLLTRLTARSEEATFEHVSSAAATPVARYLAGEVSTSRTAAKLSRLPRPALVRVLSTYVAVLDGGSQEQIARLYEALGLTRQGIRLTRSVFWWRRLDGVRMLAASGRDAPRGPLLARLGDKNHAVRLAAARALGTTADPTVVPALVHQLRHNDWSRLQLAEVLVALGEAARPYLRHIVVLPAQRASDVRLQVTVLEVLALTGDPGLAPMVHELLYAPHRDLRVCAWKAASILHIALPTPAIRIGLTDPEWEVRAQAARTAGRVGRAEVVPDLTAALADAAWWVRTHAAESLIRLGRPGEVALRTVADVADVPEARDVARRVLSEAAPPPPTMPARLGGTA